MSTESSQPDFDCFHRDELPVRLAAGNGALAHDLAQRLGSLAIQVPDGRSYTYAAIEGKVLVLPGSQDARTVIEMDLQSWANLVKDLETGPGPVVLPAWEGAAGRRHGIHRLGIRMAGHVPRATNF